MNKKELSKKLQNKEYSFFNSDEFKDLVKNAFENNLVIAYGYDSIFNLSGSIEETIDIYEETEIFVSKNKVLSLHIDVEEFETHNVNKLNKIIVDTQLHDNILYYETDIPNVIFFHHGFVFNMYDLND